MKKTLLLTILFSSIFAQTIDVDNSMVKFKIRNMNIRDVLGTISGMQGIIRFDSTNLDSSYFDVSVDLNTINTENVRRDAHLKNEDFFEITKWPNMRFKSDSISKQDTIYFVNGNLTIKNITKNVTIPFTYTETDTTITFIGSDIVNRLDYNVGIDYNNFKIGFEVTVEVNCVLNKN